MLSPKHWHQAKNKCYWNTILIQRSEILLLSTCKASWDNYSSFISQVFSHTNVIGGLEPSPLADRAYTYFWLGLSLSSPFCYLLFFLLSVFYYKVLFITSTEAPHCPSHPISKSISHSTTTHMTFPLVSVSLKQPTESISDARAFFHSLRCQFLFPHLCSAYAYLSSPRHLTLKSLAIQVVYLQGKSSI